MNYYELSRRIDVLDGKELKLYESLTGIGTPAYNRYMAARWLAWYRVFFRLKDVEMRKLQVWYFIRDLKRLYA